jgi:AraC-like DNA-binding protein
MGHLAAVKTSEAGRWTGVPPERLSPQLILLYASTFTSFHHRNTLPGAGLYLVTEGEVAYTNRGVGTITATAGDLVCLRPGFVETHSTKGYRVHAAAYRASAAEPRGVPSLSTAGLLPPLISLKNRQRVEEARAIYERMLESMLARRAAWTMEIFSALSDLIRLAFSCAAGQASEPAGWSHWERLLALVENGEAPSNAQMARTVGMSVRAFGRGFKQRFGITPKQYLLRRRLWRARETLRAGRSIKAAAFEHGFSSPSHFSRLFKQAFGAAPSTGAKARDFDTESVFPAGPLYFFTPGFGSTDFRP